LSGDASAIGEYQQIELVRRLGGCQRLPNHEARTFRREVILERAVVHLDLARSGP
jgi:hypothetical protein